ncbi:hypothetical protein O181_062462 [Austropuccinia psidii MF-1]|uniref:PITH domain-containing protein n=1 Tax=Austropuccinia psidii MF-1 TaxID=1389203 RepID=A0A9Q3I0E2_9BASI|nr:hypothetical protein [Austropuccinia psidii MF-1]
MAINNCEGDLTGADVDELDPSIAADVLSRTLGTSNSASLYSYIDQARSYALNVNQSPSSSNDISLIVRPLHTRHSISVDQSLVSLDDTGPEIIIHIVFNQLVRVRAVIVNIGRGEEAPQVCRVWTNRQSAISFEDTDQIKTDQEWELNQVEEAIEYPTRVSRFQSVSCLTFEFKNPSGGDRTRLYYLGVLGEVKQLKKDPSSQLSVGAENSADATLDSIREQFGGSQTTIR